MYKKRKWKKRILSVGLAAIMTLGGQVAVFAEESQPFTAKDGVIDEQEGDVYYEIFVRAFRDTNGDHIGDFKGIEEQIPYLADAAASSASIACDSIGSRNTRRRSLQSSPSPLNGIIPKWLWVLTIPGMMIPLRASFSCQFSPTRARAAFFNSSSLSGPVSTIFVPSIIT